MWEKLQIYMTECRNKKKSRNRDNNSVHHKCLNKFYSLFHFLMTVFEATNFPLSTFPQNLTCSIFAVFYNSSYDLLFHQGLFTNMLYMCIFL